MTERRPRLLLPCAIACAALAFATSGRADDPPPVDPREPATSTQDDALLRKLLGEPQAEEPGDAEAIDPRESLSVTVDRMRRAGRRIGDDRDTGAETRALQKQAVDDLAKLLELARQQQRRQKTPSQSPPDASGSRSEDEPMPPMPGDSPGESQPQPAPEEGVSAGEAAGTQRRDDDSQATESSEATRQTAEREREDRVAEQRRLVKDVWGHLPPAMREEMLNAYTDQPLPKYENLVRAYFRALAERSRENAPGQNDRGRSDRSPGRTE